MITPPRRILLGLVAVAVVSVVVLLLALAPPGGEPDAALEDWFAELEAGDYDEACERTDPELLPTIKAFIKIAPRDPGSPAPPAGRELSCADALAALSETVIAPITGLNPDLGETVIEGDTARVVTDQVHSTLIELERVDGEWIVSGFDVGPP